MQISCGLYHTMAVSRAGRLFVWGGNRSAPAPISREGVLWVLQGYSRGILLRREPDVGRIAVCREGLLCPT